ncbi:MAG: patatin-like phospholipase family protein [Candidatus Uhrbacteria bacterium]
MAQRKRVGLALSVGGPRGVAHVGAIQVLREHGIPIDYVAGASIGAWVGACYARSEDVDELAAKTLGYKREKVRAIFEPSLRGGLVKGIRVERLLRELLDDVTFEQLRIPLTVVTTDLVSGAEVDITTGDVVRAVRASMAIPFIFRAVEDGDRRLVDGGLINPLPVDIVRRMGADIVIAVNLEGSSLLSAVTHSRLNSSVRIAKRSFEIMSNKIAAQQAVRADIVIEPKFSQTALEYWKAYFFRDGERELLEAGRAAATEQLDAIHAALDS